MRVVSRKPGPQYWPDLLEDRRRARPSPTTSAAARCGRWLVRAMIRSCSSGVITLTVAPELFPEHLQTFNAPDRPCRPPASRRPRRPRTDPRAPRRAPAVRSRRSDDCRRTPPPVPFKQRPDPLDQFRLRAADIRHEAARLQARLARCRPVPESRGSARRRPPGPRPSTAFAGSSNTSSTAFSFRASFAGLGPPRIAANRAAGSLRPSARGPAILPSAPAQEWQSGSFDPHMRASDRLRDLPRDPPSSL